MPNRAFVSSDNPVPPDQTILLGVVRIEIRFSPTCNACDGVPLPARLTLRLAITAQ
jgi:hypothetical protein